MERIERIADVLKSKGAGSGVAVEGRIFLGDDQTLGKLKQLEDIAQGIQAQDPFSLYDRTIAHDGLYTEDIHHSGKYFAYFVFSLKGSNPDEKEALLAEALKDLVEKYGKENVLPYLPQKIVGRQITESLMVRPEIDDYPSYYSKVRTAYAEKMALEEVPKALLTKIREDEEQILSDHDWTTVYCADEGTEGLEVCSNVYWVRPADVPALKPFQDLWEHLLSVDLEDLYEVEVSLDGEYPPDSDNINGRYYAYIKASLKGNHSEQRREDLISHLPEPLVKALGKDYLLTIFPETLKGDPVTSELTLRPDPDEYPSYFNKKKVEKGKERILNQVLYNLQAELITTVEARLGGVKKIIILD